MKTCTKCNQPKSIDCFSKHKITKDGLSHTCKECNKNRHKLYLTPENRDKAKEKSALWRKNNPDKVKLHKKKYYAKGHTKRQLVREQIKSLAGGCCIVCGYNRCLSALDFHHINPQDKKFGLAQRVSTTINQQTLDEIAKCVLLCANCHRELHAGLILLSSLHPEPTPSTAVEFD